MSEFPLENFYRYVVALEPRFTDAGAALAPSMTTRSSPRSARRRLPHPNPNPTQP